MDFKLVSKNNIGAVATLILVIMLTQSRMFDFLIDTTLGRAMLVFFILGISYINKIFGVVAILFIIIMFNHSNLGLMEGFTDASGNQVSASTVSANIQQKKNELKEKINNVIDQQTASTTSSAATTTPNTTTTTTTSESFTGREGFNIIDREGNMLKGKPSNSIPVFSNSRVQNENIEPSDKSTFSGAYASV
jgi:apolipoprotein N-acyltransferase